MARKLVTVCVIEDIIPIDGADNIEKIIIKGWEIVSQKGIHSVGNSVLYFEIDSFLPQDDIRYESFMKFGTRTFEGKVGHRIKTVRLRGVFSQGVIMPLHEFPEIVDPTEDTDYAELLGIVKWEAPEVVEGGTGNQKGNFPHFIPKTDQDRIQNVYGRLKRNLAEEEFVGTLKMDGSSITIFILSDETAKKYKVEDKIGICSRNQQLQLDLEGDLNEQGIFVAGANNSNLFNALKRMQGQLGGSWAIQGELVGPGVCGGFEKFNTYQVFVYNVYDIDQQCYVNYYSFDGFCRNPWVKIQTVPIIYESQKVLNIDVKEIVEMSDGPGLQCPYREGIVWRQVTGTASFKAISNKYLAKQKD